MISASMAFFLQNTTNMTNQHWLQFLEAHRSLFDKFNDDDYYGDYNDLPDVHIAAKVLLATIFILVFVICGFGNALLCFTIFRLKRLRTVTNLFIASLAISDAFVALFCAPFDVYYYLVQDWIFGETMCTVAATLKMVSLYVSVNTLLAIAVERYYVIFHPLKPRLQKGAVLVISIMIWVVSLVIAIPTPMYARVSSGFDKDYNEVRYCGEFWTRRLAAQAYIVLLAVFEYLMPMFLMTFGYLCIVKKVWFRRTPGYVTQQQREVVMDPRKKTIRMLVTVVVSFGVCWGPYHAYNIAVHFNDRILINQTTT
ncbi:prokineticin receptor 1-like [Ptychodera flava]|uniref:prokineticin receptor 1-like n=1 Tax=Ptychodera flava TaxID=63121 RepID=UPI003969BC5A